MTTKLASTLKTPLLSGEERKSNDSVGHLDGRNLEKIRQDHIAQKSDIKTTRSWSEYFWGLYQITSLNFS